MENPYILTKINNINLHYGNGAKNELKKENKKYNFKFYYKVNNKYKNCSAGFDDIKSFTDFIQPIYKKYYMFEYIFENKQCIGPIQAWPTPPPCLECTARWQEQLLPSLQSTR